ncbi:MAG: hypothetical protein OSA88_12555 [Acidimicrobiales bacterium]|nr:hypothetical protein [Acidimicrobiales bacterium]
MQRRIGSRFTFSWSVIADLPKSLIHVFVQWGDEVLDDAALAGLDLGHMSA